ncbi:MAG: 2-C-methyl-D-erythritol 4-phosphate cytidylyltransferase [Candidatus Binatia bacterium]
MQVNGVIVAAGEGKRTGKETPKAFLPLAGRPMILHTLSRFATCKNLCKVILVTLESEVSRCQELIRSDDRLRSLECVVKPGGPRRQDSVEQGLACLDADCEVVVIHDGARPFVSSPLIDRCVDIAFEKGAVVVGVPVRDTIKVVTEDGRVRETPPRKSLWEIQTPQVFRVELIREAYLQAAQEDLEGTDDAMLVERLGASVAVLQGEKTNIKMTFEEDFLFGEALLSKGRISE